MIIYKDESVFDINSKAIVNTVNCQGIMGKGLALEFKLRYPDMYKDYNIKAKKNMIKLGKLTTYQIQDSDCIIINFPTKYYWQNPSKIEWIISGLEYFKQNYKYWKITTVAFPKLGCNNGGLDWEDVSLIMDDLLGSLTDINVYICSDECVKLGGVEDKMIGLLKSDLDWAKNLKIKNYIASEIMNAMDDIKRFRDLRNYSSMNSTTYAKIYKYFYDAVSNNKKKISTKVVQLSLPFI